MNKWILAAFPHIRIFFEIVFHIEPINRIVTAILPDLDVMFQPAAGILSGIFICVEIPLLIEKPTLIDDSVRFFFYFRPLASYRLCLHSLSRFKSFILVFDRIIFASSPLLHTVQ